MSNENRSWASSKPSSNENTPGCASAPNKFSTRYVNIVAESQNEKDFRSRCDTKGKMRSTKEMQRKLFFH
jgi:hypothetical protein